jgi:hypothetical protein
MPYLQYLRQRSKNKTMLIQTSFYVCLSKPKLIGPKAKYTTPCELDSMSFCTYVETTAFTAPTEISLYYLHLPQ